jgi:acyl dehydratase
MSTATSVHLDDLRSLIGQQLGPTAWRDVEQSAVDLFADATGDHQWIHTDPARAAEGPFGGTVAHGFMTLALIPVLTEELLSVEGASLVVNYGLDRVRFPAPALVGSPVRATAVLTAVDDVAGGIQGSMQVTIERDAGTKPVCVADALFRYYR